MKIHVKGNIFGVTAEIDDGLLKRLKNAPQILQDATNTGAKFWHDKILPGHFEKAAHGKYGYAQRAGNYLRQRKKAGKPDLVFSGSMRAEMIHDAQFTSTARGTTLKLHAHVLNFAPTMPQNSQDFYVTHRRRGPGGTSGSYPNLKREVKIVLEDEREQIARIVAADAARRFKPNQISKLTTSIESE